MNSNSIQLVQSTWAKVAGIGPHAAALFYQNLFSLDPSLKSLFKGDMTEQGKKLLAMINAAVSKLNEFESLVPVLQSMAQRHDGYGVKKSHYATVGTALIKTLGFGLGGAFTPEVKAAWEEFYGEVAKIMIDASGAED